MNAKLLTAFQTEPWSLVLLGAALFALSAFARRRGVTAPVPVSPSAVVDVDPAAAPAGRDDQHSGLVVAA